ncbi:MAG: recombinase family protein [Sphingomonas sp.]|uniref:recombinase family protein n=1 Tax=Sphingomonas sp. TaxID=28214 RepID=UPI001AC3F8C5|nr:recombinase family protein [Sphingomonas sp.]MBN8807808.1 recombinase family protein [Sphingomonas sp.]
MQNYHNTRACIYARVSATDQVNNGVSVADQIERGKQWCAQNGAILVDTVMDAGASIADRRQLHEMIARATGNGHPYDVILVSSPSRLFRNAALFGQYGQTLGEANVAIVSVT